VLLWFQELEAKVCVCPMLGYTDLMLAARAYVARLGRMDLTSKHGRLNELDKLVNLYEDVDRHLEFGTGRW
jgi:hypothetical protein